MLAMGCPFRYVLRILGCRVLCMAESAGATIRPGGAFTVKSVLVPLLKRPRIAQLIKWLVYGSLIINFGVYLFDDWMAWQSSLADDAAFGDVLEKFATSIDMVAWLGLVFLFELETYVLPDEAFKPWVIRAFLIARVICYVSIGYAAYGYTVEALDNYDVTEIVGLTDLCQVADSGTYMQADIIAYVEITPENCDSIASGNSFYQVGEDVSVIDAPTLAHVQWLGWIDISNAFVWLIVVALIEVEVWLQSQDRFSSGVLKPLRQAKSAFYLVLIANGIIWAANGYPLYGWDAFLWIFGFWAIELNLAEWEMDRINELRAAAAAGGSTYAH